jgi:hypothetical protein
MTQREVPPALYVACGVAAALWALARLLWR